MRRFSPGEWECFPPDSDRVNDDDNFYMVHAREEDENGCGVGRMVAGVTYEEDARLITAAPEMYETLETALEILKKLNPKCQCVKKITELLKKIDAEK